MEEFKVTFVRLNETGDEDWIRNSRLCAQSCQESMTAYGYLAAAWPTFVYRGFATPSRKMKKTDRSDSHITVVIGEDVEE